MNLTINSFDCARFSMGVAQIAITTAFNLASINLSGTLEERVAALEQHVQDVQRHIDNLVHVRYLSVWSLGRDDSEVHDAWQIAPPLRRRLEKMDAKFGPPTVLLYEFQMGPNDKSRTVSSMLAYHYSARRTVRIPPAVKNTMCLAHATREDFERRCPVTATRRIKNVATGRLSAIADLIYTNSASKPLSIQTFLAIVDDTYKANKLHTSANLEWWASVFAVDMQYVPRDCLDDAADAFMQALGALRRRAI